MKRLQVRGFGPIQKGDVEFGDLTVLVGPQATGKSLFVQLFKAIQDAGAIEYELGEYGFDWSDGDDPVSDYCGLYFGGGLETVIQTDTVVLRNGKPFDFRKVAVPLRGTSLKETVCLIPAQRVLVLQDGWPKPFMAYAAGDPYAIRKFSESLRKFMEDAFRRPRSLSRFPQPMGLDAGLHAVVDASVYVGSKIVLEKEGMRKRIALKPPGADFALPYNAWSAGQREFTPLLLGLYSLMPWRSRAGDIDTVIIEEPEMGLHPQAIVSFGLLVLELLVRDYRVILSTHSPVVLDLVWAIRELSSTAPDNGVKALCDIFNIDQLTVSMPALLKSALQKKYRTYYFHPTNSGVITEDISTLDPGSSDPSVAGWGGLSGFSGRIAQIVGEAVSR
ncbi:AAA family ATPase [Polyangium jinanense]|uniref:AAA family ATPase n=1 Tax=Polyangium jinanense TaxID=2829994 RepID=A0A9X3WYU8_9BACT|nr:AAA family ATPase [Polyangium jinanense]MDC3953409.1 AAA family ATPase [Polyangium jinanense]MDC3979470.1 AAA family ATPase [Polyangium jinanense]